MALKSKRPSPGASRIGKKSLPALLGEDRSSDQGSAGEIETIEARLTRKAATADTGTFATESLGQMARERRHKLLYGD